MSKINITKIRLCTKCNKSSNEVNMGKTVNKKTNKEYFNCICYPCQYLRNKQYQVKKLDNTIFIKDMILEIVEHIIEKEPEKKNKVCVICNKTSDKVKIIRFLDRINKQNLNSICVSCKDIKVGKNKINREESRKTKVKLCSICKLGSDKVNIGKYINKKNNKQYFNSSCNQCKHIEKNKRKEIKEAKEFKVIEKAIEIKEVIEKAIEIKEVIEKAIEIKVKLCSICKKSSEEVKITKYLCKRTNKIIFNSCCSPCKMIKLNIKKVKDKLNKVNIVNIIKVCSKCNKDENEIKFSKKIYKKTNKEYTSSTCNICKYLRSKLLNQDKVKIKKKTKPILQEPYIPIRFCNRCKKNSNEVMIRKTFDKRSNKYNINSTCNPCKNIRRNLISKGEYIKPVIVEITEKLCSICKKSSNEVKTYKYFNKKLNKECFNSRCFPCDLSYRKNLYKNNETYREEIKFKTTEYRNTEIGFKSQMLHDSKKNKKFDQYELDLEFLNELQTRQNNKCNITGIELVWTTKNIYQASVDRIDSSIGYLKNNVQLVVLPINRMKLNYTSEHFKIIVHKIKNPEIIQQEINIQKLYNTNKVFKEKIRRMFSKINHRKYKVNINVTILDILENIQECNMYCALTSIKMDFSGWNGISVDRIDSSKDYTKDNIQIICWCINCSKNTYTNEEFKEFLNKIKNEN